MSACQRATGSPTDTHRTVRKEHGHDAGAGGTKAEADAAFFPLPLPLPGHSQMRGAQGLPHQCCRCLPGLSSRSPVASPKTSDEEFLSGPVNRRGITQSVCTTLDDTSNVLQAGVATEVELIVKACELVGPDQIDFLINLVARLQLFLLHKLIEPTVRRASDPQHDDTQFDRRNFADVKFANWMVIKRARERTTNHLLP